MTSRTFKAVKRSRGSVKSPAINEITLPINRPRPYQEPLWDYLSNGGLRAVAVAHRRWGKDEICLSHMSCAMHERIGTYWYLLPEAAQARKAIWNAVDEETGVRRIDQAFPEHLRAATQEHEMFLRLRCGSTMQVVGSDNYNSLVGSPPIGVVLSEWALANPASWLYLSPILEKNGGWALFPYTPRGKNHGHKFWQLSQQSADWFGIRQTVDDTGVFSPKQLANIRHDLHALYGEEDGESHFQQEYYCSFDVAVMGAYYGRLIARLEADKRISVSVPYDPNFPVVTGWDLGIDDATAIWFAQVVGLECRVIDYLECRNRSLVDIARELKAKPYVYGEHFWPHDGGHREKTTGTSPARAIEDVGLRPIRTGEKRDLQERINSVRNFLPKCVFDVKCDKGVEALRSYRVDYDEKNATPRKTPKHDWASHPADAFGELAMQLGRARINPRQLVAHSSYDPFEASRPDFSDRVNGNVNPIPNVFTPPAVSHTSSWDPFSHD